MSKDIIKEAMQEWVDQQSPSTLQEAVTNLQQLRRTTMTIQQVNALIKTNPRQVSQEQLEDLDSAIRYYSNLAEEEHDPMLSILVDDWIIFFNKACALED